MWWTATVASTSSRRTSRSASTPRGWLDDTAAARVKLGRLAETTYAIYERDLRNHLIPTSATSPCSGSMHRP